MQQKNRNFQNFKLVPLNSNRVRAILERIFFPCASDFFSFCDKNYDKNPIFRDKKKCFNTEQFQETPRHQVLKKNF